MVNFEDIRKYLGGKERVGLELVCSQAFMDRFENKNGPLETFDGVSRFGNRKMPDAKRRVGHDKTLTSQTKDGRILGLDHDDMVFYAWRQLRHAFDGRLDPFRYLGINPLGEEFRLSDLQEFTEVCRGERVQRDAFRRMMLAESSYLNRPHRLEAPRQAGEPLRAERAASAAG
jgi:hypothetical protein